MLYYSWREDNLPEYYKISDNAVGVIKEFFGRHTSRKAKTLSPSKITEVHYGYAKTYRFDIPMDPENIHQMLHPFQGYLCAIPHKEFKVSELFDFYKTQFVSSQERSLGQTMLANELTCLSYWNLIDEKRKGYMNLTQFRNLLITFKYTAQDWELKDIKKEFDFLLKMNPQEIRHDDKNKDALFRFDFARKIFLERNL